MRFFSSSTGARGKSYHKGERAALLQEVNRLAYRIFHRKAYRLHCAGRDLGPAVVARDLDVVYGAARVQTQFSHTAARLRPRAEGILGREHRLEMNVQD